ncbi:MAG: YlxR family protein [Clostridia bacterium]|nr:YlxR family protein [Clostridia bacterium]
MADNKGQKKTPERRCVGCGEMKAKKMLIRVVRDPEGNIFLDTSGKKSGRGAYLCSDISCFRKARKSKRLESNLNVVIPEELYQRLESQIAEGAN